MVERRLLTRNQIARGGQLILLNNCLVTGTCHAKILVTRLGESRTCRMYFFTKNKECTGWVHDILVRTRAHQTRRSGRLLRLGFNEVAQFLSKSEVLVALSVFSSPYFFHQ
jgi:hypothetical protein